jgi:oligopeptide transport system substrate-binding protein
MHFYSGQLSNQEIQQYHSDQIDYLWLGDTADLKRVQYQYPEEFRSAPLLGTYYIGFNTNLPPFDDVRVRRAFAFATDREQLINRVFEGGLFPATGGLLPLGMPGYSEGTAIAYDPEQARSLLAEAGYPGGRNFPDTEFLCPAPRSAEIQDVLQDHWLENLGVEIQWRSMAWDAFLNRDELHKPHFFTVGTYVTHPDPDELLRISFVGMKTGWSNQEYETVIQQASETLDYDRRVKLYQRADRILVEEVPLLPVGYYRFNLLVKPWVRRFPLSTTRGWFWKEVVLEPH